MEVVAPDMLDRFPYEEPPEFASGAIQTMADTKYCLDTLNRPKDEPIGNNFSTSVIIWLLKCRLQVYTFVERTASARKIINILRCDLIEILHWQTCKTALIATIQERSDQWRWGLAITVKVVFSCLLSPKITSIILKVINISDTTWNRCKSTTGRLEIINASKLMLPHNPCSLQTVVQTKPIKSGNGDSSTRRILKTG